MKLHIESVYIRGQHSINEDAYVMNEQKKLFAVMDGATGLGGLPGSMAAEIVKQSLDTPGDQTLLQKVITGNKLLGEAVEKKTCRSISSIPKYERSTCGLAAIQLQDRTMDFVSAGDCMLFVQYKNHSIRMLTFDQIDKLDALSIRKMQQLWEQKAAETETHPNELSMEEMKKILEEIRTGIAPLLRTNRDKLNTEDGYGIIDGSPEAAGFLETGSLPLLDAKKILLLSDGLKIHTKKEHPSQSDEWLKSAQMAFEKGLHHLADQIIKIEESDPSCYEYPRLKQHDDKSGILISLT
ncbi:hypothetical protein BTO30_01550 [Domibacillus antri]|uniref:PPM-type phosphatase domain-containing protein n=1 Tax=Domibacillus antri TaxID=1714264 RepID=A0A1Q8Q9V3_9BACI|nr:hypothetical protein [Domibacillus antri]OLN24124.1 hypothetical protein BTO30_01550 [Domibacillus antri]